MKQNTWILINKEGSKIENWATYDEKTKKASVEPENTIKEAQVVSGKKINDAFPIVFLYVRRDWKLTVFICFVKYDNDNQTFMLFIDGKDYLSLPYEGEEMVEDGTENLIKGEVHLNSVELLYDN